MARPHAKVLRSDRFASRRRDVRKTRQRRRRRATITVLLLAGVSVGGWMMARSSLFQLEGIEVAGTRLLTKDEIVQASGLRVGKNMLALDVEELEARLTRLPLVDAVAVSKPTPTRVRIVIMERMPSFLLETPEGRWYLDDSATVLLAASGGSAIPTIRLGRDIAADTGDRIRSKEVVDAITLWSSLPRSLRSGAPVLEAGATGFALVRPEMRIRFGTLDRIEEKVAAVGLVIERAKRANAHYATIDVRSPMRPAADPA